MTEMHGGYNYDAGSDVDDIFPEEFRKYIRDHDQNLFSSYLICSCLFYRLLGYSTNSCWVFRNKHESDAKLASLVDSIFKWITDKLASCFRSYIFGTDQRLVQFWRAQEIIGDFGERRFGLSTRNQPFIFMRSNDKTPFSEGICSYRMKMVDFITGDGGGGGVIGRVFRNNRMESTPNIGYYSYKEYSHRDLALSCHIKSSLAIPLSDSSGRSVGVVEIVSSVESNLVAQNSFRYMLDYVEYCNCSQYIREQYDSLKITVSEIEEVMQLVSQSCCLVCAQTWMLCNRCSCLSTCESLDVYHGGFYEQEDFEYDVWLDLCNLKKGEGVVGKAATSSHNLVYCDDVSQFGITEYPWAHFARHHKLTACFATCLRSDRTGNQIYVLEFFLNPSKVNGRGPRAMLVSILEGMRKKFQTFMLASGEEIGDSLSVQVIDAGSPDKFEILEIGKLDSVENNKFEMDLIHNYVNVVNTIEEGVAIASLDKQHNSFEISTGNQGGELVVDDLAIENMGSNIGEQPIAIASRENQHNNATISSIGVINSDISLQPLVEANVVHTEENVAGASEECIINSSKLPPRNGIDISLDELKEVFGMKRKYAAKRLNVSVSTLKRVCRDYQISRWPPCKKNLDQSHFGNFAQTGSMKELGGSVPTAQNESLVTIKARYGDNFIKFKLFASSGINAFNQLVSKRLKLETGSYVVKYQDEDNDWILVRCDDDLQDYISSSASLGKTTLTMLLERI